jgi:uncharacterized membrane protein
MRPTATKAATDLAQAHRNIQQIVRLEEQALENRPLGARVAERITAIASNPWFVLVHVTFYAAWIVINVGAVRVIKPFDPFPFNFLTLMVSMEAIFLTMLVLMAQRRLMRQNQHRAHLDLQLSMLAEQESTATLKMVRRICEHLGLEEESDDAARHLEESTDVRAISKKIEKELPD